MKKKVFLCITLFALFFTFSLSAKALEINEVVDAINDWYDGMYKDEALKDLVTYKATFDPLENKIKFHFGYTCTGTCDGKILNDTAENLGSDFYWIYDDEEKSIEYKNGGTVNDKNIYEGYHVLIHAIAVLNKIGYDNESLKDGIFNEDLNYDENKYELKTVTIPDGYETAGGAMISGSMVNSLKLSIEDISIPGVKKTEVTQDDEKKENESNTANPEINKENKKNSVENPKTSDMNMYFVILPILGFSVLTFFGIKRIIKLKKI